MSLKIRNNRGGMPLWLKIIIGLSVFCLVGIIAIFVLGAMFMKNLVCTNPSEVSAMAKEVITIKEPLPADYKWVMGMNIAITKMVSAQAPDQQMLLVMTIPTAEKNAKELLGDKSARSNARASMTSVDSHGTEMVGGLPMEYEVGTIEKDGQTSKGFIGCVVDKSKGRSLMIVGIQPEGEYNLAETQMFLKAIEKI